jgi:hypothetical protein
MSIDDDDFEPEFKMRYAPIEEIDWGALRSALYSLQFFDPYLGMQATNLSLVDQFITGLEYTALREDDESRDIEALIFLNAQSQMWIFAVYELLRTWRGRVKDVLKWHQNGGLTLKIKALRKEKGFLHLREQFLADELERVRRDPTIVDRIREDLRLTHVLFSQIEFLRVSLAKHEVSGKAKSVASAPGYGRLNMWCGSLDYEMEAGQIILGMLNRRDIADGIRAFLDRGDIPSTETLSAFDEFMSLRDPPSFDQP